MTAYGSELDTEGNFWKWLYNIIINYNKLEYYFSDEQQTAEKHSGVDFNDPFM